MNPRGRMPLGSFRAPRGSRPGPRRPSSSALAARLLRPGAAEVVLALLVLAASGLLAAWPGAEVQLRADVVAQRLAPLSPLDRALRTNTVVVQGAPTLAADTTTLPEAWAASFGPTDVLLREHAASAPEPLRSLLGQHRMVLLAASVDSVPTAPGSDVRTVHVRPALTPDLAGRIRIDVGRAPEGTSDDGTPSEVLLSTASAARLDWKLGETRQRIGGSTAEGERPTAYRLVGTFSALDPGDALWSVASSSVEPAVDDNLNRGVTVEATAYLAPDDLRPVQLLRPHLDAWYPIEGIGTAAPDLVAAQLRSFGATVKDVGFGSGLFTSGLTDTLERADWDTGTARALGGLLLAAPLLALALGLLSTAQSIGRRRLATLVLARARGASGLQLRAGSALAALLVSAPAALVGALAGVGLRGGARDLPVGVWLWPAAVALLPALAVAALVPHHPALAARHTRLAGASAGVIVLAAAGTGTLAATGALNPDDPLLLALPALVAAAAAVLTTALVRWGLPIALGSARRGRGAGVLVGSSRAARGGAAVRSGLVALVVGLGIVAMTTTVLTTVHSATRGAAWQATGADLRAAGPTMTPERVRAVEALPGVRAAVPVMEVPSAFVPIGGTRTAVRLFVTDTESLARVQRESGPEGGAVDPLPRSRDGLLPAVVSTDLAADLAQAVDSAGAATGGGGAAGQGSVESVLTLREGQVRFGSTAVRDTLPGMSGAGRWLLTDRAALAARVDQGWLPSLLFVATEPALDAAETARLSERVGAVVETTAVRNRTALVADRLGDATVTWLLRVSTVGAALAGVVVLAALVSALAGASRARRHTLAVLVALRARPRELRRAVATELAGWMVPGTVVGLALGLGLGLLTVGLVDVAAFVGADEAPLRISVTAIVALLLGVLTLFLIAGGRQLAGVRDAARGRTGRTDTAGRATVAEILREEEDWG